MDGQEIVWLVQLNVVADDLVPQSEYQDKPSQTQYPEQMIPQEIAGAIEEEWSMKGIFSLLFYIKETTKWTETSIK